MYWILCLNIKRYNFGFFRKILTKLLKCKKKFKKVVDKWYLCAYNIYVTNIAGWSSSEARRAHNPKVVGSNPTPATTKSGFCQTFLLSKTPDSLGFYLSKKHIEMKSICFYILLIKDISNLLHFICSSKSLFNSANLFAYFYNLFFLL